MAGQRSNMFSVSALSDRHAKDLARALGLNPKDKPMLDKIKKNLDKAVKNLVSTAGDYDGILKELNHAIDSYDTKGFQPKSLPEMKKLQEELTQITTTMTKLSKNQNVGDSSLAALSPLMVKVAASIEGIKAGQWGNIALQRTMQEKGLGEKTNPKAVEGIYKKNSDLINKDFKKFIRDNSNLLQSKSYQSGMLKVVTAGLLGPAAVLTEPLVEFVEEQKEMFKDARRQAKEKKKQDAEDRKGLDSQKEEMAETYEKLASMFKDETVKNMYLGQAAKARADLSPSDQADKFRSNNAFAIGEAGIDATSADDFIYKSKEEKKKFFKIEVKQKNLLQEIVDLMGTSTELLNGISYQLNVMAVGGGFPGPGNRIPPVVPGPGGNKPPKPPKPPKPGTPAPSSPKGGFKPGVGPAGLVAGVLAMFADPDSAEGRLLNSNTSYGLMLGSMTGTPIGTALGGLAGFALDANDARTNPDNALRGTMANSMTMTSGFLKNTKDMFKDTTGLNSVGNVLQDAASSAGVPYPLLATFASIESGFNPNAVSSTGASGLFQFTATTWKKMVERYGGKHQGPAKGIEIGDRMDPRSNAIMGALLLKENMDTMNNLGVGVDATSLYLAHLVGPGDAANLIKRAQVHPEWDAASGVRSDKAENNSDLFFLKGKSGTRGRARTNAEFLALITNQKIGEHANAGSAAMSMSIYGGPGSTRAGVSSASAMPPSSNTRATPIPPPSSSSGSAGAYAPTGSSASKDFGSNINIDTIPMYVDDTGLIMVTMGGMV